MGSHLEGRIFGVSGTPFRYSSIMLRAKPESKPKSSLLLVASNSRSSRFKYGWNFSLIRFALLGIRLSTEASADVARCVLLRQGQADRPVPTYYKTENPGFNACEI